MRFLLDTNVVSAAMRPTPSRGLLKRLGQHEGQYGICAVTWQELAFGVRRLPEGKRKAAFDAALTDFRSVLPPILPYTADASDWFATERARLERKGVDISCEDGQIAAIAATANLILVTANTKDFSSFRELTLADWTR